MEKAVKTSRREKGRASEMSDGGGALIITLVRTRTDTTGNNMLVTATQVATVFDVKPHSHHCKCPC